MPPLFDRLRERKLFQWALAYLAGAFVMLQVLDMIADAWGVPGVAVRGFQVLVAIGFVATLVIAWYHGERGQQHVSGIELVILTALLAIGAVVIALIRPERDAAPRVAEMQPRPESGAHPAIFRVAVFEPDTVRADPARLLDGGLLQHLFSLELSRVRGIAVVEPLSFNTFLKRVNTRPGIEPYAELWAADIDYVLRTTLIPHDTSVEVTYLLAETRTGNVAMRGTFSVRNEDELPGEIRRSVAAVTRSLEETVGLSKTMDLQPWLAAPGPRLAAVRHFLQGVEYAYSGTPGGGRHMLKAVELDPNFIAPRVWLVSGLMSRGDSAAAREQLRILRSLERTAPPFDQAMINWADATVRRDREARVGHLRVALTYSPRNNVLLFNLAYTLYELGRYQEGLEALRSAVDSGWRHSLMYTLWGVLAVLNGELAGLRQTLEGALSISPQDPYLFGLLEALAQFEGDAAGHERYGHAFRQRMGESGREPAYAEMAPIYQALAEVARQKGDRERSIALLQTSVDSDPANVIARLQLARVLAEKGDSRSAITYYDAVPDSLRVRVDVLYLMSEVAERLGRRDEVEQQLTRYLELAPGGPEAVRARQRLRTLRARPTQ